MSWASHSASASNPRSPPAGDSKPLEVARRYPAVALPSGFARGLQRALGLESVQLDQPYRRSGPSWLLNPRRLEIVLTAAAYPGVHLRSASRLLLSPLPSLRFHVERLAAHGLLRTRRMGNRVLLFVPGQFPVWAEPLLATWEDPLDRRVLMIVRSHPGVSRSALGRQVLPDSGFLERSVARLRAVGALRVRGSRDDRRFRVTATWTRFEKLCHEGSPDRLQAFLTLLSSEGLRPLLEEMTLDRARVSVDAPRARIRFSLPLDPLTREPIT